MIRTKRWMRVAPALLALAVLGAACELSEPPHVIEEGHVDGFAVAVEEGELHVHIHDDSGASPIDRDPADTVLHARPAAKVQVPNSPAFSFLGPVGSDVWILPQIQNPDLLWLGWETTEIGSGVLQGNAVTWRLLGVEGPGAVQIFTNGPFGAPTIIFNSADGLPDSRVVPVGVHAHGNWAFGAAGQYKLAFEATATLADGTPVSSGPVSYTITVDRYSCADIDDAAFPTSVAGGSTVDVAYQLTNCGTDAAAFAVEAIVTAPAACGGAVTVNALDAHSLTESAVTSGSGSFTAPTCPGVYTLKVRADGPTNSYVAQSNLTIT